MSAIVNSGFDISPPSSIIAIEGSSNGFMPAGTYGYCMTFISAFGETTPGQPIISSTNSGSMNLILPTTTDNNVYARNIYRTVTNDIVNPNYKKLTTVNDNFSSKYTDIYDNSELTTDAPKFNTASSVEKIDGWISTTNPNIYSIYDNIVATGNNQQTAFLLTAEYNIISFCDVGSGVKLPFITPNTIGIYLIIRNTSLNNLLIYPFENQSISNAIVNSPIILSTISTIELVGSSISNWSILSSTGGSGGAATLSNVGGSVISLVNGSPQIGPFLSIKGLIAGNGIELAQNATDVIISSAATLSSAGGGGYQLVPNSPQTGPAFTLKNLKSGTGISLADSADDITIYNTASLNTTGFGVSLVNGIQTSPMLIKGLTAGSGISINSNSTTLTIGTTNVVTNVGSLFSLVPNSPQLGPNFTIKGLLPGSGISFAESATDITIIGSPTSSLTNVGSSFSLVPNSPQSGPSLTIKGLTAASGINLTQNATDVTIGASIILASSGAGQPLVNASPQSGSSFVIKDLIGGTGVNILSGSSALTLSLSAQLSASGAGYPLVNASPQTGASFVLKDLMAGSGINIVSNVTNLTLTNSATLTNIGTGFITLVPSSPQSAPNFIIKGLLAGNGAEITQSATDVTVSNTVTLATSNTGYSLVDGSPQSAPNFVLKDLIAGAGTQITPTLNGLTISNSNTLSTSGVGESLVNASPQSAPNFTIKGLLAGDGIELVSNVGDIEIKSTTTLDGSGVGQSLVNMGPQTAPNFIIKDLLEGNGIAFLSSPTDITLSCNNTFTSVGTGTTTLVANGTAPNFDIKGLIAGPGITLTENSTDITISTTSVENISVATGAIASPNLIDSTTLITVTGNSGNATGNLVDGSAAFLEKTIILTGDPLVNTQSYILNIGKFMSKNGIYTQNYSYSLYNIGTSLTLIWNNVYMWWSLKSIIQPEIDNTQIVVSLDSSKEYVKYSFATTQSGNLVTLSGGDVTFDSSMVDGVIIYQQITEENGSVSQSGNIITGVGTLFTPEMTGGSFYFTGGSPNVVGVTVSFVNSTTLLASVSQTVSVQGYKLIYTLSTNIVSIVDSTNAIVSTNVNIGPIFAAIYIKQPIYAIYNNKMIKSGFNIPNHTSDASSVIQFSVDYVENNVVVLKNGSYYLTNVINVGNNVKIVGQSTYIVQKNGTSFNIGDYSVLSDLYFITLSGFSTLDPTLLGVTYPQQIDNSICITNNSSFNKIINCTFLNMKKGIEINTTESKNVTIISNSFSAVVGISINATIGFSSSIITNNTFPISYIKAIDIQNNVSQLNINNNLIGYLLGGTSSGFGIYTSALLGSSNLINISNNVFSLLFLSAVYISLNTSNVIISNNTFSSCSLDTTNVLLSNQSDAVIYIKDITVSNVLITNNSISTSTRPICAFGQKTIVSNNVYNDNILANIYAKGSIVYDKDDFTSLSNLNIINDKTNFNTQVLSSATILQQTSRGSGLGVSSSISDIIIGQSMLFTDVSGIQYQNGVLLSSFSISVTSSVALPNSILNIYSSPNSEFNGINVFTTTFTIPQTVNISTDARVVIPTNIFLTPSYYYFTVTGPTGNEIILSRNYPSCTNSVFGRTIQSTDLLNQMDFVVNGAFYTTDTCVQIGELGNNVGQLKVGSAGTPIKKISNYTLTGNFTNPVPANSTITMSLAASNVISGEFLFLSSGTSMPANINVTNPRCVSNGTIIIVVANVANANYTGAAAFTLNILGIL